MNDMISLLVRSFAKQINANVGKQTDYVNSSAILLNLVKIKNENLL